MTRNSSAATDPGSGAIDAALREFFRMLQSRPVPDVFRILIDQLDETPPERVAA